MVRRTRRSRAGAHDASPDRGAPGRGAPARSDAPATGGRLGDLLVENELISPADIAEAVVRQGTTGRRLGDVLIELGRVDADQVSRVLARQAGLPVIDLAEIEPSDVAVARMPEYVARELNAVPLRFDGSVLDVAVTDGLPMVRERLEQALHCTVRLHVAPASDIDRVIDSTYRALEDIDDLVAQFESVAAPRVRAVPTSTQAQAEDAPVVRLLELILTQAVRDRASDVHIEMLDTGVRLRFRVDGRVHDIRTLPAAVGATLASRIKIMAELNIVERRRPQDGQFTVAVDDRTVDVRVAIAPTIWGEKVVLRLLDRARPLLRLQQLGMSERVEEVFREVVDAPYGMVVCAGPTGSGKTTTLYASLLEVDHDDRNVTTIEDPVEYVLPRINQIQLNEAAEVDFATGLRAILRQDPDIILVGEIRDTETARIAIRAALTGHLVLSSLHATDAASALHRLMDMEVEPFAITSAVRAVVAQRLIRRVCEDCRAPYIPSSDEMAFYRSSGGEGTEFVHGAGCTFCQRTGYRERIGVYELLQLTERVRELVVLGGSRDDIRELAIEDQRMRTLRQEGIDLVDRGVTTISEIARNIWTM